MHEWLLLVGFFILSLLVSTVVLYPFRHDRRCWIFVPVLLGLLSLAYWHWGSWPKWVDSLQAARKQEQVQAMIHAVQDPAEWINKLKQTLKTRPNSARGWYLLGRLYASQNQWQNAHTAFQRAYQLQPNNEQIAVNYAQNIWQINDQKHNAMSREILHRVLKDQPNQPDSLAMLAMDAYVNHHYQLAIDYWQRLLKLVPPSSDEAKMIQKAIVKAQTRS